MWMKLRFDDEYRFEGDLKNVEWLSLFLLSVWFGFVFLLILKKGWKDNKWSKDSSSSSNHSLLFGSRFSCCFDVSSWTSRRYHITQIFKKISCFCKRKKKVLLKELWVLEGMICSIWKEVVIDCFTSFSAVVTCFRSSFVCFSCYSCCFRKQKRKGFS